MIRLIFIVLLVFPSFILAQKYQMYELKGSVSIFNSEFETGVKQYVNKAAVREARERSHVTTTNPDGSFTLMVVELAKSERFQFLVEKDGLAVVNDTELFATAGQLDPVKVYMAPLGKLADDKNKYFHIGKTNYVKALERQIKINKEQIERLQANEMQNQNTLRENRDMIIALNNKIAEFEKKKSEADTPVGQLAQLFSVMNMDEASNLHRSALRLFQDGHLAEALKLLEDSDPSGRGDYLLAERKRIETESLNNRKETKRFIGEELFHANLYRVNYAYDSAEKCYLRILRLDSMNFQALRDYGEILQEQNNFTGALPLYLKALTASKAINEKAEIHNRLGGLYSRLNQQHTKARFHYLQAVRFFKTLTEALPDNKIFQATFADALMDLGLLYRHINLHDSTLTLYSQAIAMYERLNAEDRISHLPTLARHYKALGSLYRDFKKYTLSEDYYVKALTLQDSLNTVYNGGYDFDISETNNSMGKLYTFTEQWEKAERCLTKAIEIRVILATYYPDTYHYHLADSYHLSGQLYYFSNQPQKSVAAFAKALDIWKHLSQYQFEVFGKDYAETMVTVAGLFLDKYYSQRSSEKLYYDALRVYENLSVDLESTKNHEEQVHLIGRNLGLLYELIFLPRKADQFYSRYLNNCLKETKPREAFQFWSMGFNIYERLFEASNEPHFKSQAALYLNMMKQNQDYLSAEQHAYIKTFDDHFQHDWPSQADYYKSFDYKIPLYYSSAIINEATFYLDSGQYRLADSLSTIAVNIVKNVKNYYSTAKEKKFVETVPFNIDSTLVVYYGNRSWYKLFTSDFAGALSSAKEAVQLDPSQNWIYVNMGHGYLLTGNIKQAKSTYQMLKGKVDPYNKKNFKEIVIQDLMSLEKSGIQDKNIQPIIKWANNSL